MKRVPNETGDKRGLILESFSLWLHSQKLNTQDSFLANLLEDGITF